MESVNTAIDGTNDYDHYSLFILYKSDYLQVVFLYPSKEQFSW